MSHYRIVKYSSWLISCSVILTFLLLFFELLFFTPRPWPYVDGGDGGHIILYQSIFWIQSIDHCQVFQPTFLGLLIWKYWGLGLAVILCNISFFTKKLPPTLFKIEKTVLLGFFFALVPQVGLYFLYALKDQKLYSTGLVNTLFTPIPFIFSSPGLLIFPLITFLLAFWSLRSKDAVYLYGLFFWVVTEFMISFSLLGFLWGICA